MARQGRQGFMIYHEDGKMLKYADAESKLEIIDNLIDFSMNLENGCEVPQINTTNQMAKALYDSMINKIVRDSGKYDVKVRNNTIAAKCKSIMSVSKATGTKMTKQKAMLMAEQWYEGTHPDASECKQMQANSNEAETETTFVSEAFSESSSVAVVVSSSVPDSHVSETSQLQLIFDAAERQGVKITDDVRKLIVDEASKSSCDDVMSKLMTQPQFVKRLTLLGGMA